MYCNVIVPFERKYAPVLYTVAYYTITIALAVIAILLLAGSSYAGDPKADKAVAMAITKDLSALRASRSAASGEVGVVGVVADSPSASGDCVGGVCRPTSGVTWSSSSSGGCSSGSCGVTSSSYADNPSSSQRPRLFSGRLFRGGFLSRFRCR